MGFWIIPQEYWGQGLNFEFNFLKFKIQDPNILHLQHDELKKTGCEKFFDDKITGSKIERPGLDAAIDFARSGDVIVVWRLDHLSRSLKDLIDVVSDLESKGCFMKCIYIRIHVCRW